MSDTSKQVRFNEVDDDSEGSEPQSGGDRDAVEGPSELQHGRHRQTIKSAPKETRDCWLRLKGMSEKTKMVWIEGKRVEIVKATMEGVCVRLPEDMVQYWNAGDPVNALGKDEEFVDMAEVREHSERDQQFDQLVAKGNELHAIVPKDRWCVTLDDLKELRKLIKRAVQDGLICGDFDKDDMAVGPDIHTVNEQFIKPVTLKEGGMSWALMKHEKGLLCDLFITHSWNEGIFEFLNKVIASWPSGAQNAYCCMLANPQNLNIGSLIGEPKESPFAKSLEVATTMMVVPNSKSSIHTRLWCVYEAYIAYEDNKFIFTARPPILEAMVYRLFVLAGFSFWGFVQRYTAEHGMVNNGTWLSPFLIILLTLLSGRSSPEKYVYCCIGTRDSWYVITACLHDWSKEMAKRSIKSVGVLGTMYALFSLHFFIAAIDHTSASADKVASDELKRGYRGSVGYASCSRKGDEDAIKGDINERYGNRGSSSWRRIDAHDSGDRKQGGAIDEIDKTIDLLIDAGMSTESLRQAREGHVKLHEVGHVQWAAPVVALIWTVPFFFNYHPSGQLRVITKVLVTFDLLIAALIVKSLASKAWDERVVAVACMQKVHIYLPFLGCLAAGIEKFSEDRLFEDLCVAAAAIGLATKLLCAYLMRMDLTQMQERLGPTATELLVTYGFGVTREKVWSCFQSFSSGRARPAAAARCSPEIELGRLDS